eukprot:6209814-Pleurochrysis_carterae.AAC.1
MLRWSTSASARRSRLCLDRCKSCSTRRLRGVTKWQDGRLRQSGMSSSSGGYATCDELRWVFLERDKERDLRIRCEKGLRKEQ